MNGYAALGTLVVLTGGLAGLVWFAQRSGRNSANVTASNASADAANSAARKAEAMAQAQADAPHGMEEIAARLREGSA